MTQSLKYKGKQAYDEDVRRHPNYSDGHPRKKWQELGDVEQWSWVRNPTPRSWSTLPSRME